MKSFLSALLLLTSFLGGAQEKQICGILFDENQTPVIGANIIILSDSVEAIFGTFSDFDGLFLIPIAYQNQYIRIVSIGLKDTTLELSLQTSDTLKISLKEDTCFKSIPIYGKPINKNTTVAKPAIYLYPTQKTPFHIQHDFKGEIGTTYPAYKNGWKVIAEPDGALLNLADNRKYEYLFWDGTYTFPPTHFDYKEGFVVAKENTTDFLWKQLAHIGLNEKEINDFVVYWLPQLERNEHNFIYFHVNNDIDHSSILTVQPQPDSWIRLFMEFKSVPANYSIAEQKLPSIKRNGFTLVEWGGAVIENSATNFE